MQGHFRNILERFNTLGVNLNEVMIAGELDAHHETSLTDDDFELVCNFCYDYYMGSEVSAQDLVNVVVDLLEKHRVGLDENNEFSLELLKDNSNWGELNDVVYEELTYRI